MFGQIPDFTNGFEFLRRIWSAGGSLPGGGMMPGLSAMTPPMDLEEVDKRIHDLKAVEGWLQLNASLLRTTIQGLEVQRATLVALQTFGNALSPEAMQTAMENVARAANAPSTSPPHPFRPAAAPETVSEAEADAANAEDDDDFDAPPDTAAEAAGGEEPEPAPSPESAGPAPLPPNASLWWDLLQQQFSQIASSATAATTAPFGNLGGFGGMGAPGAEGVAPAARDNPAPNGKASPKPAAKRTPARKPAAKKAATKAAKPATRKPAAKKPRQPAAKTPAAPGTPEDSVE
ncbi:MULTISPECIES: PhaM family polyhydroxyalkanoate granule multifunctional regulatory protein [unclassified Cupriavidus]|uniref:PhaM family polyhydroxyalkanoate granule multifunctional regulatory protein n=1 Tax=unclassified Cupriavidus TaxID=2640874 RepID=UPI0028BDE04A|nr:PhaM family polyhydroxyalkanoate granule multifunctional regulatory protein [Cupriavidus sp.]